MDTHSLVMKFSFPGYFVSAVNAGSQLVVLTDHMSGIFLGEYISTIHQNTLYHKKC